MSKRTRKEKKEEEARIVAEMEAALKEKASPTEETPQKEEKPQANLYGEHAPEQIHCKRCKTLMDKGVCPTCGFRIYVPMEKKKRDKVRLIVAAVSMLVFLALFIAIQIAQS